MVASRTRTESIAPFFIVSDLAATVAFYRDRLGFETDFQAPAPNPFFAILSRDGVRLFVKEIGEGVLPQPNPQRHPFARWDSFVYTPDPDALVKDFSSLDIEAKDFDDGLRGFEVEDPDGYVLFFGRPI